MHLFRDFTVTHLQFHEFKAKMNRAFYYLLGKFCFIMKLQEVRYKTMVKLIATNFLKI